MFTTNDIPTDLPGWKSREVDRLREKFQTDTYALGDVLFWKSNDAPVPVDCFRDAFCTPPSAQATACSEHARVAIQAYVQAQARRSPEQIAEQRAEARAAHGPGIELVDVLSGERYAT